MKRGEKFVHEGDNLRHKRLEISIFEELSSLLRDDVSDPDLEGVKVTAVVLSPDYRNARVHFVVPRGHARSDVEHALGRASSFLRRGLTDALDLKRTPELRFVYEAEIAED
jgi:ribosome-binding factor A